MLTHSDIRKKFLIEYDKANITSSYPSLTDYEIATLLDKAYLALIALKVTGNNPRQAGFEADNKAIADIQPLVTTKSISNFTSGVLILNAVHYTIPYDMLYFIQATLDVTLTYYNLTPVTSKVEVTQVTHELANKYKCTTHNKPWVEVPVCYLESDKIIVLIDPEFHTPGTLWVTYVANPKKFVSNMFNSTVFELSDSMAEELINLAIIFATETVESPRLTSRTNIRPLES